MDELSRVTGWFVDLDQAGALVCEKIATDAEHSGAHRLVAVGGADTARAGHLLQVRGWEVRLRSGPNGADVELAALVGMHLAHARTKDQVVVVSADRDFAPLRQLAASLGVHLGIYSTAHWKPEQGGAQVTPLPPGAEHLLDAAFTHTGRNTIIMSELGEIVRRIADGDLPWRGQLSDLVRAHPRLVVLDPHTAGHARVMHRDMAAHTNGHAELAHTT